MAIAMEYEAEAIAEVARQFCSWAEAEPDTPECDAKTALKYLARLTAALLESADPGFDEGPDPESISDDQWKTVYSRFSSLPFNSYSTIWNPADVAEEEPVIAELADDLADIYRDLKSGLWLYDRGYVKVALWDWRQSFQSHWGRHATGALYALLAKALEDGPVL